MMKNGLLILLFFSFSCFSQNQRKIDSLLKVAETANDTTKLHCYNMISTLYQGNDNEKIKEYGIKILELATRINNKKYIAAAYLKLGVYFYFKSNYDSAAANFNKAVLLSKVANNLLVEADAHQNLGIMFSDRSEFQKAISELILAQKIHVQLKNKKNTANIKNNIAVMYIRQKNYALAEKQILEAIALTDTTKQKGLLGYPYSNLGIIYVDKEQHIKATGYYKKALREFEYTFDFYGMSACYNNLYLAYINQNKIDSAIIYNNKLKSVSKKQKDIGNDFLSNLNFEITYQRFKKNPVLAKCYLDSMRLVLHIINKPENNVAFYQELATYNFLYGNADTGHFYMDKFLTLKDSITSGENAFITSELQTKYESEKKDLELKQTNSELNLEEEKNKRKTIIIWLGTAALGGTLLFLILAFVNYRRAKKANIIIQNQNLILELQKKEVELQKNLVEEKQNEIISSINYAQRIQSAVLTGEDVWNKISKEHFIIFQPRDIVSGDFYWAHVLSNGRAVFALADCTGHGVPGGFMSMLGNSFLNELVVENKLFKADEILNRLRDKVIAALYQKGQTQQKDGMDMALCVWNKMDNSLEFAGANNALYIIRDKQLSEYKGDKMPIGSYLEENKKFAAQKIILQPNDMIYLSTDGFYDQFGGEKGKKFKSKQLEELLVEVSTVSVEEQKQVLISSFARWKKQFEQTDDVSLIGIRVI
ncbi:MAG: SpoIIE family protein phosphatase [Bacteroidia bacterium]|nr:SpoIIE family protein phosphatase [Bacteroidia bacterium]